MTQQTPTHPVAQATTFVNDFLDRVTSRLRHAYRHAIRQQQCVASIEDSGNERFGTLNVWLHTERQASASDSVRITAIASSDDPQTLRQLREALIGLGLFLESDDGMTITLTLSADKFQVEPALLASYDQMLAGLRHKTLTTVGSLEPPARPTEIAVGMQFERQPALALEALKAAGITLFTAPIWPTDSIPPEVPVGSTNAAFTPPYGPHCPVDPKRDLIGAGA